jgi:hypothetical protein
MQYQLSPEPDVKVLVLDFLLANGSQQHFSVQPTAYRRVGGDIAHIH